MTDADRLPGEHAIMDSPDRAQLDRLLGFLKVDPGNVRLLVDATETAIAARDLDEADRLVGRIADAAPGSEQACYLAGLVAMNRSEFARACDIFEELAIRARSPAVAFNLAWSLAMLGRKDEALGLLDADVIGTIGAAAMLKTQLLHEAGQLDEALGVGKAALVVFPDDAGLLGVVATLALDMEDSDLARACAMRGGDHPEALAAAAVLDLREGNTVLAKTRLDASLAVRQHNPRAWIGRGLVALLEHDPASAARDIDRGADQFGRHIGSWIAAGWAHYLAGDIETARQRFERALNIDPAFAETQGSLAVIAAATGNRDEARRLMTTALRLNPQCFSAALARIMLTSNDTAAARVIVAKAMATPIGSDGLTLATYMASLTRSTLH